MYRWFVAHSAQAATGLAFGTVLVMNASQFEMAEIKLLGSMFSRFIVFSILLRFMMPALERWLVGRRPNANRPPSTLLSTPPGGQADASVST
jgi:hypothetical protein